MLKAYANACFSTLRKNDRFGRYGGEEWLFLFTNTNEDDVVGIFKRIHNDLNAQSITGYPANEIISFSVGVSQHKVQKSSSLKSIIIAADKALYKAKSDGRNQLATENSRHPLS